MTTKPSLIGRQATITNYSGLEIQLHAKFAAMGKSPQEEVVDALTKRIRELHNALDKACSLLANEVKNYPRGTAEAGNYIKSLHQLQDVLNQGIDT